MKGLRWGGHGDAREGKWRGNWRIERVASTLHTTSEHGVSSITTADAHTSAASSRGNWRPRRFKWTRPFRRKTKSGFCGCAIAFQLASTTRWSKKYVPLAMNESKLQYWEILELCCSMKLLYWNHLKFASVSFCDTQFNSVILLLVSTASHYHHKGNHYPLRSPTVWVKQSWIRGTHKPVPQLVTKMPQR